MKTDGRGVEDDARDEEEPEAEDGAFFNTAFLVERGGLESADCGGEIWGCHFGKGIVVFWVGHIIVWGEFCDNDGDGEGEAEQGRRGGPLGDEIVKLGDEGGVLDAVFLGIPIEELCRRTSSRPDV